MKIVFVNVDDWEGMYVDGKLKKQGHSIDAADALRAVGISSEYAYIENANDLDDFGNSMPNNLSELIDAGMVKEEFRHHCAS